MKEIILFFDLDNTLYDHEKTFEYAMKECFTEMFAASKDCAEHWFPIFKKQCDHYWPEYENGRLTRNEYHFLRLSTSLSGTEWSVDSSFAKQFQNQYEQILTKFVTPFPGVQRFFEQAYQKGLKVGIISNGSSETQRQKLGSLLITKWLHNEYVVISGEQSAQKPDHRIFKMAAEKADAADESLLHVGDSWHLDIVPAIESGWQAIFLNTRNEQRATNHKPLIECQSFEEVARFLTNYLSI